MKPLSKEIGNGAAIGKQDHLFITSVKSLWNHHIFVHYKKKIALRLRSLKIVICGKVNDGFPTS